MRRRSYMDNVTAEEDDAEELEEILHDDANDTLTEQDTRHLNEILHSDKKSNASYYQTRLTKPNGISEYLIFIISKVMSFTRKRRMRPSGYWRYVIGVYKNLFLAFYFNWTVIFTAPLSSLAFIFIYPVISYLLFAFEICLKIFMDYGGGTELSKRISLDYGCSMYYDIIIILSIQII